MQFSAEQAETLTAILRWRRDVRHFRADPVDEATLTRLQEAMALAPSVGNARPWRVLRVNSPDIRTAVSEDFIRCNARAAQGYEGEQRAAYLKLKLSGLEVAPVQLAVFTDTAPEAGHGLGRATQPETLQQSTAMAIYTLWLAARAENIGLGMVSILDPDRITALMKVPDSWEFSAYLCLGYAEFADDTPLLHRTGWQENAATEWAPI